MNMQPTNWLKNTTALRNTGYMGASTDSRFGDFGLARSTSADTELRANLVKLRDRSRYQARNSGMVRRYIHLMKTNVVGEGGFKLQVRVKRVDGSMNKVLNDRVQNAWRKWTRKCSVDRKLSLTEMMSLAVGCWCRDGEAIIEIVRGQRFPKGFALKMIEADLLDETLNRPASNTQNEIRMGVELDADEAPVAYHFLTHHPGGDGWMSMDTRRRYRRVPAERIIHAYERLRPGQTRGEPHTVSMLATVQMLDGYREAEVMHRRIAASVMGFFKKMAQDAGTVTELADPDQDEDDELFSLTMTPGLLTELPRGLDFEKFDPGGVQGDYAQFEGQVKREASMGVNLSNFSLGQETQGVSYSTGRSVLIEDRDHYKASQRFIIEQILWPLFEAWVSMETISPEASIPPLFIVAVMDNYHFRGRGWDWVDPAKDVRANAEALETRQTSLSRIAADRGIDVRDLVEEIAQDEALLAEYGLTMGTISGNNKQTEQVDGDDGTGSNSTE